MALRSFIALALSMTLAAGCEPTGGGGSRRDAGRGGGEQPFQCIDTLDNDGDGLSDCLDPDCAAIAACEGIDAGPVPDTGPRPDAGLMACEATSVMTGNQIQPVDIVWVIDNSGSMDGERDIIQANLGEFARTVGAAGIDWHVVLITAEGFVRVPASLAADTERFRYVADDVQSDEAMSAALANFSRYADFLRDEAVLHFVLVTDDESGVTAGDFRTMMRGLTRQSFRAHVIASPPGAMSCTVFCMPGCSGPNGDAADNGDRYWELAMLTGGSSYSICTSDWSALFRDLTRAIAIARPLPCRYRIPDPPEGMRFDPGLVNVDLSTGDGATARLPYVGNPDGSVACPGDGRGWYYDDPADPRTILLCNDICDVIEDDAAASMNIAFGCATELI
ncbi:MAG: hypothetical protein ACK6CU_27485 [Deltaproteobacteria bacterium]|jgi:hypothetical protein